MAERVKARMAIGFALIGLLAALGCLSFAIVQVSHTTRQINAERARNTLAACENQNRQNAALVGFIVQSIPKNKRKDPRVVAYLARARKTWPQVNCAAVVSKQVQQ